MNLARIGSDRLGSSRLREWGRLARLVVEVASARLDPLVLARSKRGGDSEPRLDLLIPGSEPKPQIAHHCYLTRNHHTHIFLRLTSSTRRVNTYAVVILVLHLQMYAYGELC